LQKVDNVGFTVNFLLLHARARPQLLAAAAARFYAVDATRARRMLGLLMRQEPKPSKGADHGKRPRDSSQGLGDGKAAHKHAAAASSVAKPEFKKHIHTNASAGAKPATAAVDAGPVALSRRQLKNLAKRKKKEAAAAAAVGVGAEGDASSSGTSAPSAGAAAAAAVKPKKAPLDPGKKAEVNCNWQALKKALVSGGPVITRCTPPCLPPTCSCLSLLTILFSRSSTPLHPTVPGKFNASASTPAAASTAPAAAAVPGVGLGGAAFASTSSIVALDCEMVAGSWRGAGSFGSLLFCDTLNSCGRWP